MKFPLMRCGQPWLVLTFLMTLVPSECLLGQQLGVNIGAQLTPPTSRPAGGSTNSILSDPSISLLFGSVQQLDRLSDDRRPLAISPGADAVFGIESIVRKSSDIGDLLRRSKSAHGISVQNRTPITKDTRVRSQRVGQVIASGSYWAPARQDLDTMMSKMDSRLVNDVIVVKGPYASRYGPGFSFVDLDFIHAPRFNDGLQTHGMTGTTYKTNGQQWSGRQSAWGGSEDFGFVLSYGHQAGNDYETGQAGFFLPTSYNSRDLFGVFGFDLSDDSRIEVNLLRLDQKNMEFPGLVYDLDFLRTEGYEFNYIHESPWIGDRFTAEVWYNRTTFEGDSLGEGKSRQIPVLHNRVQIDGRPAGPIFSDGPNGEPGSAVTDGDGLSGGYRFMTTFTKQRGKQSLGTDLIFLNQQLREVEAFFSNTSRFPVRIPRSYSADIGLFYEEVYRPTDRWTLKGGGRMDLIWTDAEDDPGSNLDRFAAFQSVTFDQSFQLFSAYLTSEFKVTPDLTIDMGLGTAQRPPTLTDLYAVRAFTGSLQRGVTALSGSPGLDPEILYQVDLGAKYDNNRWKLGIHAFHSWIQNYLTYDYNAHPIELAQGAEFVAIVNTDLATFVGGEAYAEYEANDALTFFGSLNGVDARDRTRTGNGVSERFGNPRSFRHHPAETLPGIAPLEARAGFLLQDPSPQRRWGVEFLARIVDNQDRFAWSLGEVQTPGFTVYNIRSYFRLNKWLWTAGVENFTNKFYREHIDYRFGRGVFRPGINFYVGTQVQY